MKINLLSRIILTFAIVLSTTFVSFGQSPNWDWAKNNGGTNNDEGWSIANDASGNSYVFGSFASDSITFGTTQLINNSLPFIGRDIFITKYDINGNVLWAKKAGGSADDYPFSGTTDSFGNVYVTGYCVGSITFDTITLSGGGFRDVFLAKYDSNGNILWAKRAGGSGDDEGESVIVDASGKIYLTGFFGSSSITFGSSTLTNTTTGSSDIFLVKYDTNGNALWARKAGGNVYDYSTSVCVDAFNGVYVGGYFYSPTITFGVTTITNSAGVNLFIAKYDNSGNLLWVKNPGVGYTNGVATNSLGDVYATGAIANTPVVFGLDTLTSLGNYDMFIAKYDTAGNPVWARSAGGTAGDIGKALAVDALSNVYVTGMYQSPFMSFPSDTLINSDSSMNSEVYIVSYDNIGNVQWSKGVYGNSNRMEGGNSISTFSGDVFLTGYFYSDTLTFDSFYLVNDTTYGSTDMFVAKLNPSIITEISEQQIGVDNPFAIFPNPTSGQITISSLDNFEELIITDLLGQTILQKKTNARDISLNLDKAGIYFITLKSDRQIITKKIIVQH